MTVGANSDRQVGDIISNANSPVFMKYATPLRQTMANILDVQIEALFGRVKIHFNCLQTISSLKGKCCNV